MQDTTRVDITDSRADMFSGKIQKQLFRTLVLNGSLRMEDVRTIMGTKDRLEQFLALVRSTGVARVDYTRAINGTIIYVPETVDDKNLLRF